MKKIAKNKQINFYEDSLYAEGVFYFYSKAILAQLVEQLFRKQQVMGSSPVDGSNVLCLYHRIRIIREPVLWVFAKSLFKVRAT